MTRASSLIAAAALAVSAAAGPFIAPAAFAQTVRAHGDLEAESFVQTQAGRVLSVLNDRGSDLAEKKKIFRSMIDQVADVPRITGFVLGRYRRSLTPDQYRDFSEAFRAYADNVYESRLGEYRGQTLKVTGSVVRQPGDVVVSSEVVGGQGAPAAVNWRVLKGSDGRWRAVDVEVAGVWLAITEQQDFVSTLDNHGGDINVLIRQLQTQAARGGRG
jgi:phospholipid transport system substrate-binding protein